MQLNFLDWIIVIGYLVFALALAGFFVRRASKGEDEFFASGRSLPWWLLGTSMVATTFSADAPIDARKPNGYTTSEANKRATAKKSLGNHYNL